MRLLELYIARYKKFTDQSIMFNYHEDNDLIESIYNDLKITAIVGPNGSGKTTILSMITMIFRYLQRHQHKISSDFKLVYEINKNIICIEKKDGNIFIKINKDEKKLLLEMQRIDGKNIYSRNKYQVNLDIEDITYEEIKDFLPGKVIVSAFDKEYNIDYHNRLICDRLVKFNTEYYIQSSFGLDLSLGIYRVYLKYFSNDNLFKEALESINIHLSEYVDMWYSPLLLPIEELNIEYISGYDQKWLKVIKELKNILKQKGIEDVENYISSILDGSIFKKYSIGISEDDFSEKFNINKFLASDDINKDILAVLINNKCFYFNDVYIIRKIEYSMKDMSTGEKMILWRLFFTLNNIKNNSLIIIEEPEVHLNYLWVKHLISIFILLLKDYSAHLILSSHNYTFINNLFSEQIIILDEDTIKYPEVNTLLADEDVIVNMLSDGTTKDNYIEEIIFSAINSNDKDKLRRVFNNIGESYIKVLLFKKLVEIGEINVESNKRRE